MADNTGTAIGGGVGAVGGSFFGPVGTAVGSAVGSGIGGVIGSLFNGGDSNNNGEALAAEQAQAATRATNQEWTDANTNQQFWNKVYSQFNPQEQAVTAAPSAPAYQNIANNAKSMFNNSLNANGGPTGSVDQNQVGQNLNTKGAGASRTQDINDFLKDTQQNQQSAEQRELSMFGQEQGQNATNQDFMNAQKQGVVDQAKNTTDIGNAWQDYYNEQPNMGNKVGSALGGAAGNIIGSKISNSMFGNNGNPGDMKNAVIDANGYGYQTDDTEDK